MTGGGFSWGAVFEDINLDGQLDLLVAQSYIKWPIHKLWKLSARSYLQTSQGGQLQHSDALGLNNPYYGQSPVIADIDSDGRPDVLWLNMDGPVRAFLNRSTADYFALAVDDRADLLGTRIRVETTGGRSYTREVMTSTGMLTDQTTHMVFGLGENERLERVVIMRIDGSVEVIEADDLDAADMSL